MNVGVNERRACATDRQFQSHPIIGLACNVYLAVYAFPMTTTVEAIYEKGKLLLQKPLPLPENAHVRVTVELDPERKAWLHLSEDSLMKVWNNPPDDVFNELLSK
jgi:predicted DNA-binding antitoxin AbrB/MazE fold protein